MIDTLIDGQSLTALEVYTVKMPNLPSAQRDVSYTAVPGRVHGSLSRKLGWKDVTITIPMTYYDLNNLQVKKRQVGALIQAAQRIAFSNDPDFYLLVKNADVSDVTPDSTEAVATFNITAVVDPFQYQNTPVVTISAATTLVNPGGQTAEPLITLYGSDHCELVINGDVVGVDAVDGSVTIDSRLQTCYKGATNLDNKMTGAFPTLVPGKNTIQFAAGTTKIEIDERWCWTL
ncbi:hypothetical protein [Loigolactobacillus bifermentans]|uniref:Phage-related protein n=1 Tax=Loigolactobacillus bifermentans DSM 20003 TaxID=1423726 RepID=A0A0R1H5U9_9LACO|nr:hypothetical protein [Loigolactobacillus bifermentans]KRK38978.1 hypothetical protein FC07_GL002694 [Loigolactobacillus bifermentans DSM 20003]QGG59137.1 hypothetical protein LB003_00930 [Loigolactobacillus bifermentans]